MNRKISRANRKSPSQVLAEFHRTTPELAWGTCLVHNPRIFKRFDPVWLVALSLPRSAVEALRAARKQGRLTMSAYLGKDSFAGAFHGNSFITLTCPGHCVIAQVLPDGSDVRCGIERFRGMGSVPVALSDGSHDDFDLFLANWQETSTSLTHDELVRLGEVLRTHTLATGTRGLLTICEPRFRVEPDTPASN